MNKKTYTYFVSYTFKIGNYSGFGDAIVELDGPVNGIISLNDMKELIRDKELHEVIILNFILI